VVEAVYAIDAFPDDDLLWRIEWIGGVGYNSSVPSDPLIDICLAQLPGGEMNPLSARARSAHTKRVVKISVGLLPYVAITSVWRQRRPVVIDLPACRHRLRLDTPSCRTVVLGDVATSAIPRGSYLFGVSWPDVRRTLLVAFKRDGDPYAVMIPTAEIIRFYYATSTRLAQALFWGEYYETFNAERSGIFEEGVVRVHLRRWMEDQDAPQVACGIEFGLPPGGFPQVVGRQPCLRQSSLCCAKDTGDHWHRHSEFLCHFPTRMGSLTAQPKV
jgi:hypothetical protein